MYSYTRTVIKNRCSAIGVTPRSELVLVQYGSIADVAEWRVRLASNPDHAALSRSVGELVLLPEVRKQSITTVILTNGFSCREQVKHGTGRTAMHLARVLALGLKQRKHAITNREDAAVLTP
jgi:hypothetical protein